MPEVPQTVRKSSHFTKMPGLRYTARSPGPRRGEMPDDSICTLYYPNHPADSVWLRHALLYYDYVGTTVPIDLEKDLDRWALPEHLKEVRDHGQYQPMLGPDNMLGVFDESTRRRPKPHAVLAHRSPPMSMPC